MPKLADDFFDWFKTTTGEAPTSEMLTHCRRELFHTIWRLILDDKFMEACEHGIEILCPDNIWRRFYFRVFTYSADYPEKVLLATIRSLSRCPCPRCLLTSDQFNQLGTVNDNKRRAKLHRVDDHRHRGLVRRARAKVYEKNLAPYGAAVKRILGPESYVPVMNAFSNVSTFTWDIFQMLAPDLMHELELGVWKMTFVHLIRILVANAGDAITSLNWRYRQMPAFGRDTIWRFTNNTSAMKRLAARDYEDLLQCAMPVFEGLLDDDVYGDNDVIQDLLFSMAYFHALAKLRMHTDATLERLREATKDLGYQLCRFAKSTCEHFVTKELPREEAARRKKAARKAPTSTVDSSPQFKAFNLTTVKMHLIGYYPLEIPFFGTTDSYSTAPGELEHNKNGAVTQISNLECREAELLRIQTKVQAAAAAPPIATLNTSSKRKRGTAKARAKSTGTTLSFADSESLPYTPPDFPHHISQSRNFYFTLDNWLDENTGDPAIKNFRRDLKNHLLARILHPDYSSDGSEYSANDRNNLFIVNNRIYIHKILRVNFTTYNDASDDHPFEYSRVIGIFHCDVQHKLRGYVSAAVPVTFLWFVPELDDTAYAFVNPDEVIREAHLIPAFARGLNDNSDIPSLGRPNGQQDWLYHYVNFFVDRDMLMRYLGGGVGHSYQVFVPDPEPDAAEMEIEEWSDEGSVLGQDEPLEPELDNSDLEEEEEEEDLAAQSGSDRDSEWDSESESDSDSGEPDLGPEDGEDIGDAQAADNYDISL
ncbi:hypothetical protein MIND_00767500 [Mycena indigotica]|uniref:Uncharacterized protein n=1 Tax=Mycena indigotica TaxID=2126181 RepID=A0A8H6W3Y0_9AGAR|nr:uncharacterized protein MIND_00767500 [Mycena indigotica]KAF7302011.1 hypothetical protein MIND_00767500 [Mycena indigotica]